MLSFSKEKGSVFSLHDTAGFAGLFGENTLIQTETAIAVEEDAKRRYDMRRRKEIRKQKEREHTIKAEICEETTNSNWQIDTQ